MYTSNMSNWQDFATDLEIDRFLEEGAVHFETEMTLAFTESFGRSPNVSGDGYWCPEHAVCRRGCPQRRWGKYGAAGILFVHRESGRFFLTQRSGAIHFGGTWSIPGGALDLGESAEEGARREVEEELGVGALGVATAEFVDQAGEGWAYTTVVVEVDEMFSVGRFDWETTGAGWFTIQEMSTLRLHPGFRKSFWRVVRQWTQWRAM